MGTDLAGNKKWTGLKKGPVGMLFSPRGSKGGVVTTGSRKGENPTVENGSGVTSSTENLTETDDSPQNGKPNIFGRLRRNEDDVTLTPGGNSTGRAKRRPSGPMNLLRKAMFTQNNNKEDNSIIMEASRDQREISESFQIDPLFDDEMTISRPSSVKPPSCSDLSSSAPYSSRTDMSGMSSLKKGDEKQTDGILQRPPRPAGPGEREVDRPPPSSNNRKAVPKNPQSVNKTTKGGQGTTNTDQAPRSPRPMNTGVRNTLVSAISDPSASDVNGGMDTSFHPTLSQKLQIGKQEIEKKMEARKIPPIDPLKLAPTTKGHDRRAVGAKVGSTTGKTTRSSAKSTGTRRKSIGSEAARKEYAAKEATEANPESPGRPTTPTFLHERSKVTSKQSRNRKPQPSREKTEERRRQNSDGTSRSRGRSGPRHSYDQSPKTPGSQHSSKDRKYTQHRARNENESSMELPKISNLDGSPSRTRNGPTKSPLPNTSTDSQDADTKRHGRSQDARHATRRREERRAEEEKKRCKSLDESLSRDKSLQNDHPDLIEHPDQQDTDRSHSSGQHRNRDHSSPHSRESNRKRTEKSPTTLERKRSKSMDDSQSRSKSPHHLSRRSSYNSQNRSPSSGPRGVRGDSSPHSREPQRKRTEKRPSTEEIKRITSKDDTQGRSKSPHYQTRRASYDSQNRSHSSGHRSQRGESSPHSRESHRKRGEERPRTPERKRSISMDDNQGRSHSRHHGSRNQNHNEESDPSRSRSREASTHRHDMLSPNLAVRKRSRSLDESLSSRRSHHESVRDNPTIDQEDKSTTMNELWDELTKYGPPNLKKQENERSKKIVSKAEKERRDGLGKSSRRTSTTRPSQSPGRRSSNHDDDGTVASAGTLSRRQTRRERKERGDEASASRSSRPSSSPSHRSSSSSHRQVPQTPSGRSERTKSTSREKLEKMLHQNDTKKDFSNPEEPPFSPAVLSTDEPEDKASTSPRSVSIDESERTASAPLQSAIETQMPGDNTGPTSSVEPPMPNPQGETYDSIPHSAILTAGHYKAVNKMADRNFHSPLGDPLPVGTYSPTQRQGNGRTKLLASSASSTVTTTEAKSPREEGSTIATSTTTNQDNDVLISPTSRAAKLKNHLRQLEQQHGSVSSSNRSRSEPPKSSSQTRQSSRHPPRQRSSEDANGSGLPKAHPASHHGTSSSTRDRSESADLSRRHRHPLIPQTDNSPGHGSFSALKTSTTMSIKSPTKDLGRFLKSPKSDDADESTAKSKQRARTTNMSLDSVPVSESTTES